ncbi:MAG: tetratricopeptide repeat protein [Leptolyngbya sp.]|nr:tetratricopeptide repeat protein [Candidatus Melainabacteria bacterium]
MSLEQHEEQTQSVGELLKHAAAAMDMRKYGDVEYLCAQALEVLDSSKADDHPSKVMALEYMGNALTGLERYSDAAAFYKLALDVAVRIYGQENQVYISLIHKLARTYESLSLLDESESFYRNANELAARHLSQNHPLRESISEGHAYLVSRMKKRKEKVGEIMHSFRQPKGTSESLENHDNLNTLAAAHEKQFAHSPAPEQELYPSESAEQIDGDEILPEVFEPTQKTQKAEPRDYKGLRTKSSKYNSSAESMQAVVTGVMVLIGIGLFGVIGVQLYQRFLTPSATSSADANQPADSAASSQYANSYTSVNGKVKLKFGDGDAGQVVVAGKELTAKILHDADINSVDSALKKPLKINVSEADGALIDDAGNYYYLETSPEAGTINAMKSVSDSMRRAYMLRNTYPLNAQSMKEAQISYKNPITGKSSAPIFHSYSGDQGWNKNNIDEKSTFEESFEHGNMWNNEPPFAPGAVHVFILATDVDAQKNDYEGRGVVAIIKGADHNGAPLKVSKDKAFILVSTPKSVRSSAGSAATTKMQSDTDGALVNFRRPKN